MNAYKLYILLAGLLVLAIGAAIWLPGSIQASAADEPPGAAPQQRPTLTAVATAAPRPTLTPLAANRPSGPAEIYLRLSADPGGAIAPASTMAYQLITHNSGDADAADIHIRLPFAPDAQTPLDAAFDDSGAWVSAVLTDAIELRFAALKPDQTITATLWLRISPAAQLGRDLTTRARLSWGAHDGDRARLSNLAPLVIAQAAESQRPAALAIEPAASMHATSFALTYAGFASNERVSLWYHRDNGGAVSLGQVRADARGRIGYRLTASALDAGHYTVIAAGQYSQVSAIGSFTLTKSQPTPSPAG